MSARRPPVFVALDTPDPAHAAALVARIAPHIGGIKLGLEFFCAAGPAGVRAVAAAAGDADLPVFLDLKLHDIPNTVAGAVRALRPLAPAFLTVHAGGGDTMLRAAVEAATEAGTNAPRLLAVTVLTSLAGADLEAVGQLGPARAQVLRLAHLAQTAGCAGIVCSPQEVAAVRNAFGPGLTLVVPGIRPEGAAAGDQKRAATPQAAITAGADWLVIGRPITGADDPEAAAAAIAEGLAL